MVYKYPIVFAGHDRYACYDRAYRNNITDRR